MPALTHTGDARTHTLSVLVENRAGVLTRIAGMFARRGFNIYSLAVAPTDDERFSRITIVVDVESKPLEQITKQLNRLIALVGAVVPDALRLHEGCAGCVLLGHSRVVLDADRPLKHVDVQGSVVLVPACLLARLKLQDRAGDLRRLLLRIGNRLVEHGELLRLEAVHASLVAERSAYGIGEPLVLVQEGAWQRPCRTRIPRASHDEDGQSRVGIDREQRRVYRDGRAGGVGEGLAP